MPRRTILVLAILNLVAAGLPAKESDKEERPRNVILIGWDGAQRDHVNESLKRNELPNLKKLSDEGTYVEIDIEGATDTKAGWAQILTGYYPTVTGVYSNGRYQPIPRGLTVFERLEQHFGPANIETLAVIGKKGNVDAGGPKKVRVKEQEDNAEAGGGGAKRKRPKRPVGKIIEEDGVKYRLVPGKPYYYSKDNMDLFENGLKLDEKVGTRALELLDKHKEQRFFLFVHFAEIDQKGHQHGENSQEYGDALASADLWTGKIMEKLKALGLYDKTLLYVTADHGFDEGAKGHRNAPHVFLATNDKRVIRHGLRQDITPTILERFGVEPGSLEPALDGFTLSRPCKRPKPVLGPQGTSKDASKPGRGQGQRRPRANLMGAGFDNWFNKLTRAYEQNDRERMGRLLERMGRYRQRIRKGKAGTLEPVSEP